MESLISKYSAKTTWFMALNATWGSFIFGYNIGVMAPLEDCLSAYFGWGGDEDTYFYIFTPAMHLGATFGALAGGTIGDKIGRRRAMLFYDVIVLIGCALVALPTTAFYPIGRFICGIGAGGFAMLVPPYLKETSPPELYGRIGSLVQLQVTIGICVSYAMALALPTGNYDDSDMTYFWIFIYVFQGFFALIQMVGFLCVYRHDTPTWLLRMNMKDKALESLLQIYTEEEAPKQLQKLQDNQIGDINMSDSAQNEVQEPSIQQLLCCRAGTSKMMRVGLLINVFQQTVGINAILSYLSVIFKEMSSDVLIIRVLTLVGGVVNMLATVLIFPLIGVVGRKKLLIWGNIGILVTMAGVAVFNMLEGTVGPVPAIVMIMLYLVFFEAGIGPVCWIYCGEILTSQAISICTGMNWFANFVTVLIFPFLLEGLGFPLTFTVYAVIAGLSIVYFCFDLVETKGLSAQNIKAIFQKQKN